MFDSPIEWCLVCRDWVAIDQSRAECARQRRCEPGRCPLASLFKCGEREAALAAKTDPPAAARKSP